MMRIGIISERMTKKEIFSFDRFQKNVIMCPQNPFELVVVRLPETLEQLQRKSKRHIEKIIKKAEGLARELGAKKLLTSDGLKGLGFDSAEDAVKAQKREEFLSVVPQCIRYYAERCGLEIPLYGLCITTDKMDRITEYLMEKLCCDVRKMTICTEDMTATEKACEIFFDETGLLTEVVRNYAPKDFDVIIDTSIPCVRIGRNVVVCGAELGFFTDGIAVDHFEIAACLKNVETARRVSSYILNKKS